MSDIIEIDLKKDINKVPSFGTVSVTEIPNPYEPHITNHKVDIHGRPLTEYFNKLIKADTYKVVVNGKYIDLNEEYIVKPNDVITYIPLVFGGGGGGGKQVLSMVAMIALTVVAPGIGTSMAQGMSSIYAATGIYSTALATAFSAGVMIAGSLVVSKLLAPSTPNLNATPTAQQESPTYSWTGIKTQVTSGNPIPVLYGTQKLGGTIIDNTLNYQGKDQYLKTLLSLCHGEIEEISSENVFVNDEPLTSFFTTEDSVKLQTRTGTFDQTMMDNFNTSSYNNVVNYRLDTQNDARIFTTQSTNIDNFRIHLRFDKGLYYYNDQGKFVPRENNFRVQYRKVGETTWNYLKQYKKERYIEYEHRRNRNTYWSTSSSPEIYTYYEYNAGSEGGDSFEDKYTQRTSRTTLTGKARITEAENYTETSEISIVDKTNQPFSYIIELYQPDAPNPTKLEKGQYEIIVTPLDNFSESTRQKGIPLLSVLEEVNTTPFNYGGEALVGLELLATDELSGNQPNYNIIATRKPLPLTKPNGDIVYKASNNPAWCCYDLLTNKEYGGGGKISHEDIDFNKFQEWADFCDNPSIINRYNTFSFTYLNKSYNDFRLKIGVRDISVTPLGSNGAYYLSFNRCIVIPLSDLDENSIFSKETLNKELGDIVFKNYFGDYITVRAHQIDNIEFVQADIFSSPYTVQKVNVLKISWRSLHSTSPEEYTKYNPYLGTSWTEQGMDLTINLEFQTQEYQEAPKLRYNGVMDSLGNIWEKCQEIGKIGRGQVIQKGTEYSCVFDKPQPMSFTFNDENMRDIQVQYTDINEIATEVEIQYSDKDINYEMTQVNLRDNSLFNTQEVPNKSVIQAIGITSQEEALQFGRYLLANNKFIRRTVTGIVDLEALAVTVGDVVGVQSSVPKWGSSGTIIATDSNNIILSEGITTESDKQYVIKVKSKDSDTLTDYTLDTSGGNNIYNNETKIPIVNTVQEGDVYVFGEYNNDTLPFRVTGINRNTKLDRQVELTEYNESILDFNVENDTLRRINTPTKPKNELTYLTINEGLVKNKSGNAEVLISLGWESTSPNTTYDIYYHPYIDGVLSENLSDRVYLSKGFARTSYSTILLDITEGNTYRFYVKDKNSSAIVYEDFTVLGLSIPPNSVTNFRGNSSNGDLRLQWDANTEVDLSHYLVSLDNGEYQKVTETFVDFTKLKVKTYIASIKAVDTRGNESDEVSIEVVVQEPSVQTQIEDSYLLEKAFRDGLMTIFVGIDSDKTNAVNYDIWKIPLSSLTVDEFTYASTQLEGLSFDNLNDTTFKYYLDGSWYLCTKAQLLVIQRMLGYATTNALVDGNVRVFNKQPFPPYSEGDIWIDGDTVRICNTEKLT